MLFLRRPQTPGESRILTNYLVESHGVCEVEAALNQLQNLNNQRLVKKLEPEPGKRDSRYAHLLSQLNAGNLAESSVTQTENIASASDPKLAQRVTALEQQLAVLTEQMACLTELFEDK